MNFRVTPSNNIIIEKTTPITETPKLPSRIENEESAGIGSSILNHATATIIIILKNFEFNKKNLCSLF